MGLLSRSLIRKFLQRFFPRIADWQFDVLLIIMLLMVSGLSVVKYRSEETRKRAMLKEMADVRDKANDLENRTQEIGRLPDGRSRVGVMISGKPTIILEEHDRAAASFSKEDFTGCLTHSQRAVKAHEETLKILTGIANYGSDGGAYLPAQETAELYYLAAMCAGRLGKNELAKRYQQEVETHLRQSRNSGADTQPPK